MEIYFKQLVDAFNKDYKTEVVNIPKEEKPTIKSRHFIDRNNGNKEGITFGFTGVRGNLIKNKKIPEGLKKMLIEKAKIIIHGGEQSGFDNMIEQFARENGIPTLVFKPNFDLYDKYGKRIYLARNREIANVAHIIIGAVAKGTRGTLNTLYTSLKYEKPTYVFNINAKNPRILKLKLKETNE